MDLYASSPLKARVAPLLANDPLGFADPNAIRPRRAAIVAPFVPSLGIQLADLTIDDVNISTTETTIGGPTFISSSNSPYALFGQIAFNRDQNRQGYLFCLTAPATINVYGFALIKAGGGALWGTEFFAQPIRFEHDNQFAYILPAEFFVNQAAIF
jgi:hypothetical protein